MRLWDRFNYWTERRFVRGAQYRLLLIAALIGLISIAGGAAVLAAGSGFSNAGEAIWWAFLRLTDPGYLGDDVGTVNRVVSTILTVLGYVVFLGALVAVMTQWLDTRMKKLESGLTPVARDDHVLIVGMSNRTQTIIREILLSEGRVRRFLRRHGMRQLHIVVMAERVDATIAQNLRDAVGEPWDETKVTLRSGTPLRIEHLERVDALHASVIIMPGSEFELGGADKTDSYTVKALLSLASGGQYLESQPRADGAGHAWPFVVAEIFDARKVPIAERAYPGALETVASDSIVSRLLAQNVRHRGLSAVYNEILTHGGGAEIYIRRHPEFNGERFDQVAAAFSTSVLLGIVRADEGNNVPYLNPPGDLVLREEDRFVHLASSYEASELRGGLPAEPWARGPIRIAESGGLQCRILILGWNNKVPALIHEFNTYRRDRFEIVVLSTTSAAERSRALERYDITPSNLSIRQIEGDYGEIADLEGVKPSDYDAVLLVSSDRREGAEESDARTIVGSLLLEERGIPGPDTQVIIELLDPDNERLVDRSDGEVIISPLILSHMLAHVALRPELGTVFTELFTAGGAEITFRTFEHLFGDAAGEGSVSFADIQRAAHAKGEIALGVQSGAPDFSLQLCPSPDTVHRPGHGARLVTLTAYE